jgi:putative transposase
MIFQFLIAWLAVRINRHQDHVITYLLEENRILKAKLKGKRIQLTDTERRRLAVLAHPIDRKYLKDISTIATPDTLQRWYRRLVMQEPNGTSQSKPLGRPRVAAEIEQLVVRMTYENPRWGYRRIQGALSNLGYDIDKTTVRNILRRNHIDPAPIRGKARINWSQFIKLHWEVLDLSGFFKVQLRAVAYLWTVFAQLGGNLSARGVPLLGLIQHNTLSVATSVAL